MIPRFSIAMATSLALPVCLAACGGDDTTPPPGDGSLYQRLGGNSGIATAIDAIVAAEVMDPEIAPFFAPAGQPGASPNVQQIKECLVLQLGAAAGGPEVYPGTVSGGFSCRSMREAHANLTISSAVFDKFVSIAAATLTSAGVSPGDVATIGGVLNGTKADVTAGNAVLYQRLGGNTGIAQAIDAIVAAEVMDPEIAPFFTPATMPGASPNVQQIKECLVLQLGAASGGPEVYPGMVSGGFMCRTMAEAHAGLGISSAIFDKFVTIAAGVLTSAGVAAGDVAIIGEVLNSTKPAVAQ
jgi:hemoglobin